MTAAAAIAAVRTPFAMVPRELIERYGKVLGAHGLAMFVLLHASANNDSDIVVFRSADVGEPLGWGKRYVNKFFGQIEQKDLKGVLYEEVELPAGKSKALGWKAWRLLLRRPGAPAKLPPQRSQVGTIVPGKVAAVGTKVPASAAQVGTTVPAGGNHSSRTIRNKADSFLDSKAPIPPTPLSRPANQASSEIPKAGGSSATPHAPPGGNGAAATGDSRFARLYRWIKFRWEEANAPEKLPWADEQELSVALGAALRNTFVDRRVWDEILLKQCVENRFASDLGPRRREPPARWITKLWEYRDGPLNKYGKPKAGGDDDGDATTGRAATIAALRTNKTLARAAVNRAAAEGALRRIAERARQATGGGGMPVDAGHVRSRHG